MTTLRMYIMSFCCLKGVSLTVARGEFIVILGKSGGGKTSMLNVFGTIDTPTKGELKICDQSGLAFSLSFLVFSCRTTFLQAFVQALKMLNSRTFACATSASCFKLSIYSGQ